MPPPGNITRRLNQRNYSNSSTQSSHHHHVEFAENSRERYHRSSLQQEWEEGHESDGGCHGNDNGAVSASLSLSFDHGPGGAGGSGSYYNSTSSMRSVGSTGSQGSGRGYFSGHAIASHLVNGETKFPTAANYASDAQRSDAATVCSGSVADDIEEESVFSADTNAAPGSVSLAGNPNPSPPSSVKMTLGNNAVSSRPSSVNPPLYQVNTGVVGHASNTDVIIEAVVPEKGLLLQNPPVAVMQREQPSDPPMNFHNNMGPPLSRLLHQRHHHHHFAEGNSSVAGSVKSYESNACSDVVAQVDTDDCGGSLDMEEMQSVNSQEDIPRTEGAYGTANTSATTDISSRTSAAAQPGSDADVDGVKPPATNPLLCSSESNSNGRTSPGGTIYKGRGNRRYQGRYMHLPLKRFHQNGVDLGEQNTNDGEDDGNSPRNRIIYRGHSRSQSPQAKHRQSRSRSRDRHLKNGNRKQSTSRSRSRDRDRGPPHHKTNYKRSNEMNNSTNGYKDGYNDYDHRKPRAREGRWQQAGSRGGCGGSRYQRNGYHDDYKSHNQNDNQQDGRDISNEHTFNSNDEHRGRGASWSPSRNRNRRR